MRSWLEYYDHDFAARFAEALEPTVANGINLEWNLQDAHAENYELEYDPHLIPGKFGAIRLLGYTNYANMGDYHFAIDQFENQTTKDTHGPEYRRPPRNRSAQVRRRTQLRAAVERTIQGIHASGLERRAA